MAASLLKGGLPLLQIKLFYTHVFTILVLTCSFLNKYIESIFIFIFLCQKKLELTSFLLLTTKAFTDVYMVCRIFTFNRTHVE